MLTSSQSAGKPGFRSAQETDWREVRPPAYFWGYLSLFAPCILGDLCVLCVFLSFPSKSFLCRGQIYTTKGTKSTKVFIRIFFILCVLCELCVPLGFRQNLFSAWGKFIPQRAPRAQRFLSEFFLFSVYFVIFVCLLVSVKIFSLQGFYLYHKGHQEHKGFFLTFFILCVLCDLCVPLGFRQNLFSTGVLFIPQRALRTQRIFSDFFIFCVLCELCVPLGFPSKSFLYMGQIYTTRGTKNTKAFIRLFLFFVYFVCFVCFLVSVKIISLQSLNLYHKGHQEHKGFFQTFFILCVLCELCELH